MKRDMDLVRDILLAVEAAPIHLRDELTFEGQEPERLKVHVELIIRAGYLERPFARGVGRATKWHGLTLTWNGHEFLDTIRDPKIWEQTKSGASQLGSWSIGLLGELAKGAIRAKATELGLPLG